MMLRPGRTASRNILIVDDSPIIRKVVKRAVTLSRLPAQTLIEATDGREALKILHREWIDLVITDLFMPGMNGSELLNAISADKFLASVPVIVLSAASSASDLEPLIDGFPRVFLRKPFTPEIVRDAIRGLLGE